MFIINKKPCKTQKIKFKEEFNQCNDGSWVLVFEDDFNNDNLDLTKWKYGPRIRYCNNEQQYYTKGSNIEINNSILKLKANKEIRYAKAVDYFSDNQILFCKDKNMGLNKRFFYYTSANIESKEKFSYGKYEARIKIPKGKGFWPAFWLYSEDPIYNEIDIFEFWNEYKFYFFYSPSKSARTIHMTTHYEYFKDKNKLQCSQSYKGIDFSQDFHIYTLIWEKDKIEWYVDGILLRRDYKYYYKKFLKYKPSDCIIKTNKEYLLNMVYPEDPMYIILNLAILGGKEAPNNSTIFPNQMEIDWVRYYKRK